MIKAGPVPSANSTEDRYRDQRHSCKHICSTKQPSNQSQGFLWHQTWIMNEGELAGKCRLCADWVLSLYPANVPGHRSLTEHCWYSNRPISHSKRGICHVMTQFLFPRYCQSFISAHAQALLLVPASLKYTHTCRDNSCSVVSVTVIIQSK